MNKKLFSLLFLALTSCSLIGESYSDTPIATNAITTLAATLTITTEPTTLPNAMQYQCLEIGNELPSNSNLEGTIVMKTDDNLYAYLWEVTSQSFNEFPKEDGDRLSSFEVSPDRKHIAYSHSLANLEKDRIDVSTSEGEIIWSSEPKDSLYLFDWFDNDHLIILEHEPRALFLLNPFSNERQELRVDYPDSELFLGDWFPRWAYTSGGLPVYDPTLTRVIYPKSDPITGELEYPIVLWDVENDKVINEIITVDNWGETPIWTKDGRQFIIAMNVNPNVPYPRTKEFFTVSRDGTVEQLTHFAEHFNETNFYDRYVLSPNGKLLAFWIQTIPSSYGSDILLAVLNIETKEVTNYCIKGDPFADNAAIPSDPIWSPDSTKLLVVSREPQNTKVRRVILVDILGGSATQIEKDLEPVGWMASP